MKTYSETQVGAIVDILKQSGVIALKGETDSYLMCNALDEEAVHTTLSVRKKPQENPLILYMANIQMVERYVPNITHKAFKLADSLWPCSMVMLLPIGKEIPESISCGLGATGVCCPVSKFVRELSCLLDAPLIVISASHGVVSLDDPGISGVVEHSLYKGENPVIFDARESLHRVQSECEELLSS